MKQALINSPLLFKWLISSYMSHTFVIDISIWHHFNLFMVGWVAAWTIFPTFSYISNSDNTYLVLFLTKYTCRYHYHAFYQAHRKTCKIWKIVQEGGWNLPNYWRFIRFYVQWKPENTFRTQNFFKSIFK